MEYGNVTISGNGIKNGKTISNMKWSMGMRLYLIGMEYGNVTIWQWNEKWEYDYI